MQKHDPFAISQEAWGMVERLVAAEVVATVLAYVGAVGVWIGLGCMGTSEKQRPILFVDYY